MDIPYQQSNFTQGELDPRIHARADMEMYYKGAKKIRNAMVIPQGGVQGRWGTTYVDSSATTNPDGINGTILKIGQSIYLLEFGPLVIYVYLENKLLTVVPITTPYQTEDIKTLKFTQVRNRLVITNQNFTPRQLVNTADGPYVVPSTVGVIFLQVASTPWLPPAGTIAAVYFSGAVPATVAGTRTLYINRVYYIRVESSALTVVGTLYNTAADAGLGSLLGNPYQFVSGAAPGACRLNVYSIFTLSEIAFTNKPCYDFSGGYSGLTFTPSATFGTISVPLTVTASAPIFTAQHVGGIFNANGGIVRITSRTATVATGYTVHEFANTNPISGATAKLLEPVWSDLRGNPSVVKTFENRLWFFGSVLLPNGSWGSCLEEYYNFDDSEKFPDNAISWYPESGESNIISSVTAANSLIVHTDSGTYSTPTFNEVPLTPENFVLKIQNEDGVSPDIEPIVVDNQIMYIDKSGNNVKNMIWDTGQSKYALNNISVKAAHLIRNPVDMEVFTNPTFVSGSLCVFINADGTVTTLQTLMQEGIGAYSGNDSQSYPLGVPTPSRFLRMVSSGDRLWFWVQRSINGANVINIEEMDFTVKTDSSYSSPFVQNNMIGLTALRNCVVDVTRDGFVYKGLTVNGAGILRIPGTFTTLARATVGHRFDPILIPLPIATIPGTPCNLYSYKHIKQVWIHYFETRGATINGNEILTQTLPVDFSTTLTLPSGISDPYTPGGGYMPGIDDIIIQQPNPLPFTIMAIAYLLEA